MLEKIRNLGSAVKDLVLWLAIPLAFIVGYIAYLLGAKRTLQNEVDSLKSDKKVEESINVAKEQEKISDNAVDEFERAYAKYLDRSGRVSESSRTVQQGSTGTKEDDTAEGSSDN